MHATKVDTLLNRVGKEVDYYVSMHDFRRTFATICNLLRFNIYVTKDFLITRLNQELMSQVDMFKFQMRN